MLSPQQYDRINTTFTCCGVCIGSWCSSCSQAHGATLALWGHSFLTVAEVLANHIFTNSGPHIAHTDATRLWVPHVIVGVDFSIFCAGILAKQKQREMKWVSFEKESSTFYAFSLFCQELLEDWCHVSMLNMKVLWSPVTGKLGKMLVGRFCFLWTGPG